MSKPHSETVPLSIIDGSDGLLAVRFTYLPGAPETGPTYDCGGTPADPPEIEIVGANYVSEDGKVSAIPVGLGEHEEERVIEYLMENWEPPSGPDPDDWRDQRMDEELTK